MSSSKRVASRFLAASRGVSTSAFNFDDFDGFDVPDEPVEPTIHMQLDREIGGLARYVNAADMLKPPGLRVVKDGRLRLWQNKAWSVTVDAPNEAAAKRLALRVQRNLVSKRALSASDPFLHHLPLYVVYDLGWAKIDGISESGSRKTPVQDLKRSILRKGRLTFGRRGLDLTGKGGAYTLTVRPALAKLRGKFKSQRLSGTLEEIDSQLDVLIREVQSLTR